MYTILSSVRKKLNNLPDVSFQEFFTDYIIQVDNESINNEMNSLVRMNKLDVMGLDKLVNKYLMEVRNDYNKWSSTMLYRFV